MSNKNYIQINSLPSDVYSPRSPLFDTNYLKKTADFQQEYRSLNYNYGISERSEASTLKEQRIQYLENQIKELKDNMYYEMIKKDECINNMARENIQLKTKLNFDKIDKTSTAKVNKQVPLPKQNKMKSNTTIEETTPTSPQNENLKDKVKQLEGYINKLSNQIYINKTFYQNDDDYIMSQIDMWKNKSDYLMNLYPNTVADLKRQIFAQNLDFQTNIKETKDKNKQILVNLELAYESLFKKSEGEIEYLLKEREDLELKTKNIKKVLHIKK
jgi:hypothetical protein